MGPRPRARRGPAPERVGGPHGRAGDRLGAVRRAGRDLELGQDGEGRVLGAAEEGGELGSHEGEALAESGKVRSAARTE